MACREWSASLICFFIFFARFLFSHRLLVQNREDLILAHDHALRAFDGDVAAGIFSEQNTVAHLNVQRDNGAIFQAFALPNGQHFTLLGFLFGGIWDIEAASQGFSLFFDSLDYNAVIQRTNFHRFRPPGPEEMECNLSARTINLSG